MEIKLEVKEVLNYYKKLVENFNKNSNSLNKSKIKLDYLEKLKNIENTNKYNTKIDEEKQNIKSYEKKIKDLNTKIEKNSYLFKIVVNDLFKLVTNKLSKDYPNDKILAIIENLKQTSSIQEDFYGNTTYYDYTYKFGVKLENINKQFLFPIFQGDMSCNLDALDIYMNLTLTKYYYNLFKDGFLTNNVKDFIDEDWKDLFWGVVETNIKNRIKEINRKKNQEIYRLQKHYESQLEDLIR